MYIVLVTVHTCIATSVSTASQAKYTRYHLARQDTSMKLCSRSSYLSDSGVLAEDFVRSGSLSTNVDRHFSATKWNTETHTLDQVIALSWILGS